MYSLASLSLRWDSRQTQRLASEQSWRDVCRNSGLRPGQVYQAEHRAFCSFHSVGGRVCRSHWDCHGTSRTFKRGTPTFPSRPWTPSRTWTRTLQLRDFLLGRPRCFGLDLLDLCDPQITAVLPGCLFKTPQMLEGSFSLFTLYHFIFKWLVPYFQILIENFLTPIILRVFEVAYFYCGTINMHGVLRYSARWWTQPFINSSGSSTEQSEVFSSLVDAALHKIWLKSHWIKWGVQLAGGRSTS